MAEFRFRQVLESCFSPAQIERLGQLTVGIAGCGGLGSNCAVALVRSGFARLRLADFDVVEASNLNRQAYTPAHLGRPKADCLAEVLRQINPDLEVTVCRDRLDAARARDFFVPCDAVVEAFDQAAAKAMLAGVFLPSGKLYVTASGLAGFGASDRLRVRRLGPTAYLVGDEVSGVGPDRKPYAPCVQIAAAKEADIVLAWALGAPILPA
jgi:sulfur carrier protein ThiS adenylyltransferase